MNELVTQIAPQLAVSQTPLELAAAAPFATVSEHAVSNAPEVGEQGSFLYQNQAAKTPTSEQYFIQQPPAEMSKFQKLKAKLLGKSALSKSIVDVTTLYDTGDGKVALPYKSKGTNPALEKYQNDFALAMSQNAYTLKAENSFDAADKLQAPTIEPKGDWIDDEPWEDTSQETTLFKPGEFVKEAPKFSDQVNDQTRLNPITYVNGVRQQLGTNTEGRPSATLTEHESLVGLRDFLQDVSSTKDGYLSEVAGSMLENLTFIGKREYDEATAGIADQWRQRLRANPNLQLCVVTGKITPGMVKSDAYLFDNILKNLNEDEITEFGSRIITDVMDLTAKPEDAAIIMLDDWTISGQQLIGAASGVANQNPKYKSSIEVQLIAAAETRIQQGLPVWTYDNQYAEMRDMYMPVNAYYKANTAHEDNAPSSGAHITGAHCAVDYDYNNVIGNMSNTLDRDMPPATNIVRPYRSGIKLTQAERLQRVKIRVEQTKTPMQIMLDDVAPQYTKGPHDDIY